MNEEQEKVWDILKTPPRRPDEVGYKGITKIDTASFYCPYIPLLIVEPQNEQRTEESLGDLKDSSETADSVGRL
jgi:hypothetical protein